MAKRILIIEDEENVLELLNVNLARRGYEVSTAEASASQNIMWTIYHRI